MNVVYSASDLYSSLAGISLTSLLMNNQNADEIHVIIMDNGISEGNKEKLTNTVQKFGRDILFVPLADSLKDININVQKWNISTFGRLFEASSLPDLDKVIHVDCDTIVVDSLEPLWNMDMSHAVVAGAPDCLSDAYKSNIGLKPTDKYLNAGLIVLNLKRIREKQLEAVFLQYIEKNSRFLTYVDQEILNSCISEDEKIELPLKYNSYSILHYLNYKHLKILRHVNHMFSQENYKEAVDHPALVHYTGCFLEGTRPWIEGDSHPLKSLFESYKSASQWADMPAWADQRLEKSKIISRCARIVPKWIICPLVGYVHGVYIPRRNKRQQEG